MFINEITFTPYIPTTIIGLIGLLFIYLYFYLKNKDDKKLEEIKSTRPSDRIKAIEIYLSELGVHIDTKVLTPEQKYNLLTKSLNAKTKKYLIIAVTTILLCIILFLFISTNSNKVANPSQDSITITKKDVIVDGTVYNSNSTNKLPHIIVSIIDKDKNPLSKSPYETGNDGRFVIKARLNIIKSSNTTESISYILLKKKNCQDLKIPIDTTKLSGLNLKFSCL